MAQRLRKASLLPMPSLRAKAWRVMSLYVRLRDKGVCFTCGAKNPMEKCNAGHYKHNRLDYDEMNINCQCVSCNKWKHGNLDRYSMELIRKYGLDAVLDLERRANQVHKYSRQELEEVIERYTEKIRQLKGGSRDAK